MREFHSTSRTLVAEVDQRGRFVYNHMVMKAADLDATFAALADPTRRAILSRLASGQATVMELAEPFEMSQPAISKHLKVLERAGLITRGRDAQRRPCCLEAKPLAEATAGSSGTGSSGKSTSSASTACSRK